MRTVTQLRRMKLTRKFDNYQKVKDLESFFFDVSYSKFSKFRNTGNVF